MTPFLFCNPAHPDDAQHTDERKHFGWYQNWHPLPGRRKMQNVAVLLLPLPGSC